MGTFKNFWNHIGKAKYYILIGAFLIQMVILDENNIIKYFQRKRDIAELEAEIEYYQKEYDKSTEQLEKLTNNPEYLERIARERYFMKQPNEDIYVFED